MRDHTDRPGIVPAARRRAGRLAIGGAFGVAVAAVVLTTLATRPAHTPAPVVCAAYGVVAPIATLAPYGEVAVVDEREAAELARGCAHAGGHELTPDCTLWATGATPTRVTVLDATTCAAVRAS